MGHIRVAVRCRGRTAREKQERSAVVIEMADGNDNADKNSTTNEAYVTINSNSVGHGKTYLVDQTFGPEADQQTVFENVAVPMFEDFYHRNINGTIFAYGQTGTGKTYTMCGPAGTVPELSSESGIIPRIIGLLFETLKLSPPDDYAVTVSYLELYNEMLTDLLLEDLSSKRTSGYTPPLRIVEDKQSRSIKVVNLTEKVVVDPQSAIKTLIQGLRRRKTASTKLNDHSSRSHTIFTIILHRKDPHSQTFTTSKLNLVDLAGSENIYKSGADSVRAKEAGNINQSLLALGRVINTLADSTDNSIPGEFTISAAHVPYRESKLTRILQDSLGGHTLTALIATISPAATNSDETALTLDYASRAKNIRNLPQPALESDVMLKSFLVRELCDTVSRLEADLRATRRKNGVFLDEANFESLKKEAQELKIQLKEASTEQSRLLVKHKREINILANDKDQLRSESLALKTELEKASKDITQLKAQMSILKTERDADRQTIQSIKSDLELARNAHKKELEDSSQLAHNAIDKLLSAVIHESDLKSDMRKSIVDTITSFKTTYLKEIGRVQSENHTLLEQALQRASSRLNRELGHASENINKHGEAFYNYVERQHLQALLDMDNKASITLIVDKVQGMIMQNLRLLQSEVLASNENMVSRVKTYHQQEREAIGHQAATFIKNTNAELSTIQKHIQTPSVSTQTLNDIDANMDRLRQGTTNLIWNSQEEEFRHKAVISDSKMTLKSLRKYVGDENADSWSIVEQSVSPNTNRKSPSKLPAPKTPQHQYSSPTRQNILKPLLKRSMIPQLSKATSDIGPKKKRKVLLAVENIN